MGQDNSVKAASTAPENTFYDFNAKNLEATETINTSKYKGKVCVVVNVASK